MAAGGADESDAAALHQALRLSGPQTVGALERGDHYPSLDLAFRICDVFDLPVEAVFSLNWAPLLWLPAGLVFFPAD